MTISPDARTPLLFAHRGTALLAPENTCAAFDLALQHNSDILETDVRLSRDGIVMVTHDETLERTTNGTGRVRDTTLVELKKLDAACRYRDLAGQSYKGDSLALITLQELFELYPGVGINIDIKDNDLLAATAVAEVIEQHALSQWVNVGSFHANVIQHFRACVPGVNTAASRGEVASLVFAKVPSKALPYQILQIPTSYWGIQLSRTRLIQKVQRAGVKIVYWTINDAKTMQRLLDRGADGLVTDRADIARELFDQNKST